MVHDGRKKRHLQRKVKKQKKTVLRQLLTNCVWLSVQHAYRRTTERRATDLMKAKTDENETKQNTTTKNTSWRRLWPIDFCEQTSTSTLSLDYPLFCPSCHVRTYTTACRSPSLASSAAIQLTMKGSAPFRSMDLAPFSLVRGYSRPLVSVNTKTSEVIQ